MNDNTKPQDGTKKSQQNAMTGGTPAVVDQVKHAATEVGSQAKEKVDSALEAQRERAAGSIGGIADAIRETGRALRSKQPSTPAEYADKAADQIDRVGSYFRDRTIGDLIADVERFARREPAIFVGTTFALGLVAARFLKSSRHHEEQSEASEASSGQIRRSPRTANAGSRGGSGGVTGSL